MSDIKIHLYTSTKTAMRNGGTDAGLKVVPITEEWLAGLTPAQRDLAVLYCGPDTEGAPQALDVPQPTLEAAADALAAKVEADAELQRDKKEKERRRAAELDRLVADVKASPIEELVRESEHSVEIGLPGRSAWTAEGRCTNGINEAGRRGEVEAEKERLVGLRRARIEAKAAAAAAALAARKQQTLDAISPFLTAEQHKRLAEGLLPERELRDAVRSHLFAPLDRFERYQRITDQDVRRLLGDQDPYGVEPIEYATGPAGRLTAKGYDRLQEIRRLAPQSENAGGSQDAKIEVLSHRAGLESADEWALARRSAKVTVEFYDLTLSREYALEEEVLGDEEDE